MNNTSKLPSFPFLSRRPSSNNGSNGWWTLWYQDSSMDINSRAMLEQWLLWEVNDDSYPYNKERGASDGGDDDEARQPSNDDEQQDHEHNHHSNNSSSSSSKRHKHHLQQKVSSIWKRSVEATAGAFSLDRSLSASSLPTKTYRKEEHYFVQPMSN